MYNYLYFENYPDIIYTYSTKWLIINCLQFTYKYLSFLLLKHLQTSFCQFINVYELPPLDWSPVIVSAICKKIAF